MNRKESNASQRYQELTADVLVISAVYFTFVHFVICFLYFGCELLLGVQIDGVFSLQGSSSSALNLVGYESKSVAHTFVLSQLNNTPLFSFGRGGFMFESLISAYDGKCVLWGPFAGASRVIST